MNLKETLNDLATLAMGIVALALWSVMLSCLTGCEHPLFGDKVEFDIAVTNRVYCAVEVYVDGQYLGEVGPASTAQFTKDIEVEKGSPVYSSREASYAYITMSAKSIVSPPARQSISQSVSMYIQDDRVNDIEFNYWDFDQYIRTGVLWFDLVIQNRTDEPIMVKVNGDTLIGLLRPQTDTQAKARLQCFWIANDAVGQARAVFTATAYRDDGQKLSRAKEVTVQNNKIESVTFTASDF